VTSPGSHNLTSSAGDDRQQDAIVLRAASPPRAYRQAPCFHLIRSDTDSSKRQRRRSRERDRHGWTSPDCWSLLTWMRNLRNPRPCGNRCARGRRSGDCLTKADRPQDDLIRAMPSVARPWRQLVGKTGGRGKARRRGRLREEFGSETRICPLMDEPAWSAGGRYLGRPGRSGEIKRCEPPTRRLILPIRSCADIEVTMGVGHRADHVTGKVRQGATRWAA